MSSSSSSSDDEISQTTRVMSRAIRTIKILEDKYYTLSWENDYLRESYDRLSAAFEEEVEQSKEKEMCLIKIKELEKEIAELKNKLLKKEKKMKKKAKNEASTSGTKK